MLYSFSISSSSIFGFKRCLEHLVVFSTPSKKSNAGKPTSPWTSTRLQQMFPWRRLVPAGPKDIGDDLDVQLAARRLKQSSCFRGPAPRASGTPQHPSKSCRFSMSHCDSAIWIFVGNDRSMQLRWKSIDPLHWISLSRMRSLPSAPLAHHGLVVTRLGKGHYPDDREDDGQEDAAAHVPQRQ